LTSRRGTGTGLRVRDEVGKGLLSGGTVILLLGKFALSWAKWGSSCRDAAMTWVGEVVRREGR
jgi:hypothetical protein